MMFHSGNSEIEKPLSVQFETRSRADVMKVCALLVKGIGDTILQKRIEIFVHGEYSNSGKSAVTDGLVAAFSDDCSSYNLPESPLMEDYVGQALASKIYKDISVKSVNCLFTMMAGSSGSGALKINDNTEFYRDSRGNRGLDLRTSCMNYDVSPDIYIGFDISSVPKSKWARDWDIQILDKFLQTPQMAEILDHLRSFHERRQTRLQAKEQHINSPG